MQGDRSVRQGAAQQAVQKKASSSASSAGVAMQAGMAQSSPAAAGSQLAVQRKANSESVQLKSNDEEKEQSDQDVKSKASEGVEGASSGLPHAAKIQESFGKHDVSGVKARTGGKAKEAADEIGAEAYAQGESTAFASSPDLHTAAHEAAHVMQQRAGKSPAGGVGKEGDDLEKEADEIADKVVGGESAEAALDAMGGGDGAGDDGDPASEAVQSKSAQGKASDGGGGMAAAPGGDDVQRKAVQMDAAADKAPEKITLRIGGLPVTVQLPPEFKGKTFTKSMTKSLCKGVNLSQVRVKFDDKWTILSGSVSGNFAARLGTKKLKTSWKLNVNKGGDVAGHVKDVPIEDGPLSGTLSASWAGKKLKATAKASINADVELGEVKGFGARFLTGTNAEISFTHEKILKAKSTAASVMLTQKGEDRVKLTGRGSYVAPSKFDGDGDVDVVKPFEINLPKLKLKSGRKSKGKFKFGSWSFGDLPLDINFGGGLLKSVMNKLKFSKFGLGGFGKFDIKNPFKLPSIGGWTPKLGTGTKLNIDFAKNLLKKLKGVADWKLEFGGKDLFSGLFKGMSFDPKKWAFSGIGSGNLIGDFDLGSFGGFNFKALGLGKKLKLPKLGIKANMLTDFLGKIDLGVFKGPKFAFGSLDLSWLKGKGLKKAKGKFTFPSMPKFSMKPYSVQLDKDTTGDADFANNKLNSVSGQVGATVLKGDEKLAHGRLEKAHILVAKKQFSGDGSLDLLTEIKLPKKGGWQGIIEPTNGKSIAFKFAASTLKQARGLVQVRVEKDAKKLVRVGATGNYDGKSFTGKGSAKLLAKLPFSKGKTKGSIERTGTNLQAAHILKNALKKAEGTIAAAAKTDTKYGPLDFTGSLKKGKLDLSKSPSLTGDVTATLKKEFTVGKKTWKTKILPKSAATIALKANAPQSIAGAPLNMQLLKAGKKAATIDAKTKLNLRTLVLDLNARGTLHKGLVLHDKPMTVIRRESVVESLVIGNNSLLKARGDIGLAIHDAAGKPYGEGDLKGAWVRKQGFTGKGKFGLKQEITLKKKGAYGVTLEPTKGPAIAASLVKSKVKTLKGELSARVDKDGKPLARAKAKGTYNGKTFTGKGSADLLQNVPFKKGKTEGLVEAKGTKLSALHIAANKFTKAEGSLSAKLKTSTKYGPLELRGQIEKAKLVGGKEPSISGNVKATLLKTFTIGKGTWKTQIIKGSQVQVAVQNNVPTSISGTPLKLVVLKDGKKAADLDAKTKINLRTLVVDLSAKGILYKGLVLLKKPNTVVAKNSPLEKLVIAGNELTQAKGAIHLGFQDAAGKPLAEGSLKGRYVKKQGFTGSGQLKIKQEIKLKKKGKYQVSLEPTKGDTVKADFKRSELTKFKGALSARVDKDNKPLARVKADGTYNGKDFTGKGSAKLLQDVTWTKGKTVVTLEKKGTELSLLKITKSKFTQAKGKASVRFQTTTANGLLDLRGSLKDAKITAGKTMSVSGDVSAELLKDYTIGKGVWQTRVLAKAKATLKVRDSKLNSLETSKIALIVLKDKKKAAEIDLELKLNLRTVVLDAKGSGRVMKKLSFGEATKVEVEKDTGVQELVIAGNKLTKFKGQVSLSVYDKTKTKLIENAYLKGAWTKAAGFTGEGGAKTARALTAGKPEGNHVVVKKGAGVKKVSVAKNKFVRAEGGALQVEAHDKQGKLLTGGLTLKTLVNTPKGMVFTGGGNLTFFRTLKIGAKGGKGVRVKKTTSVGVSVVNNEFARVGGTLLIGIDGKGGKEIAEGSLEKVDIDMRGETPIVSGKASVTTKKEFKLGSAVTVHKDLKAVAEIQKSELISAGLENAKFTIHKLNDGKGAEGKVDKATLKFPKVGAPDFSFLGGAVDDFKMLAGKLVGKLNQLSFKDGKFGGLGKGTYKPNKIVTALMTLRFDPTDGLLIPWVRLKGSINMPLLKEHKFLQKGMPGQKAWRLAKFRMTIKGISAEMKMTAGYEVGTEPLFLKAKVENKTEFNPEKMELPDLEAKAEVKGTAYARGHLTLDGMLGVGDSDVAFAGIRARGKLKPKFQASLTPKGKIFTKNGKLGGSVSADFDVAATAALEASLSLIATLCGSTEKVDIWDDKIDFGRLFGFKWSGDLGFGAPAGKADVGEDTLIAPSSAKQLSKTAEKHYKATTGISDTPAEKATDIKGASGGGMKAMQDKLETLKILAAMVKAGLALADLGISSLPPGIKTVTAIVVEGKFLKASEACLKLSMALDNAEKTGLLKELIKKGGGLGKTMELLKDYNDIINALSGPSVGDMIKNAQGVSDFRSAACGTLTKCGNVAAKWEGSRNSTIQSEWKWWRDEPDCSWDDVTSRGAMSHAAGFLEWTGAIDKGTDPNQEMSKKDWNRRLKHLKKLWRRDDQQFVDKYLAGSKKYSIGG